MSEQFVLAPAPSSALTLSSGAEGIFELTDLAGGLSVIAAAAGTFEISQPVAQLVVSTTGLQGIAGPEGPEGPAGDGDIDGAMNDNVGGIGVFKNENVGILHFYGIAAGSSKITVTLDVANDQIDIDVVDANLTLAQSQVVNLVADLALKAPLASPALTGNPTAPTQAALDASTKIATTAYVDAATNAIIAAADVMVFKGVIDCSTNPNYPAADRGWSYRVSVAGKIGGASGVNVEIGDLLLCLTDGTASGNQAAVGAQWSIAQTNVDGAVIGPASAVDATPIVFDGATGKLIKNITFASFKSSLAIVAGDLSDFAATVRATVLTGLSLASSTVISATDTILQALGQLQAQVTLRALAARALTAGTGLTGGGDLTADRSFAIDKATDANVRAAAADKVVTSDRIETASAFVALTINTTPTPDEVTTNGTILDWDAFINATLTHTANMTLINPSNGQPGTWRSIAFTQHSSPVTITLGSQYKTVGAAGLVVSTGSGAKDMINILCVTTTEFWLFHSKAMS